eukprot:TRINITY_DN22229_c0_g1_i1.p1 TRINITY_DN22229_c0_g1~~TRINITY_DN22229_c0_g1_i1.p1  ORF type:complete len:597 (-),score=163.64 TRINITY_DN22229_c0_g1_i1:72-1862(-)
MNGFSPKGPSAVVMEGPTKLEVPVSETPLGKEDDEVALPTVMIPVSEGRLFQWNFEMEIYMKKLLLKHALTSEKLNFAARPSIERIEDLLFYRLAYKNLMQFPLFTRRGEDMAAKIDLLITQWPKLSALSSKAQKRSEDDSGVMNLMITMFDMGVSTELEKTVLRTAKITGNSQQEQEMSVRKQSIELGLKVLKEIRQTGSAQSFIDRITSASKISELPKEYQALVRLVHKGVLPNILENFSPEKVGKINTLYHLTPRRTMKAILAITNPLKMMSSLLSLFFARPLGSRSLLQRMFVVITDISKTESVIKEKRKAVNNSDICKKVTEWIAKNYDPAPFVDMDEDDEDIMSKVAASRSSEAKADGSKRAFVEQMLLDSTIKPDIPAVFVQNMTEELLANIYQFATLEMRRKDKEQFIDMLGDETFSELVKSILPVFYEPLVEIYAHANMADFLGEVFRMIKRNIEVSDKKVDMETKAQMHSSVMEQFEEKVFQFVKRILQKDKGVINETLTWIASFFEWNDKQTLRLPDLILELRDDERADVINEIWQWVQYKRRDRHLKDIERKKNTDPPPTQTVLLKLIPSFTKQVKEILDPTAR